MLVRLGAAAIAALALVAVIGWGVPAVFGPFTVECGGLDASVCDRTWRQVASDLDDDGPAWMPVTRVEIHGASDEDPSCGTFIIERWIFASVIESDCL